MTVYENAPKKRSQPAGSIEHAWENCVRKKITHPRYRVRCDVAMRRFYLFRGDPTLLTEISDNMIHQFESAVIDSGAGGNTAKHYACALRRILRLIDDKLCRPSLHGWKKRDYKPGAPGTLSHFFELTYVPLRLIDASAETVHQHRMTLDALGRFLGREPMVADLRDEVMAGFMREALQSGRSPCTANNRRCYFSAWWRFAKRRGLLDTMPDVPKLKEFLREPSSWSLEEMSQIVYSILQESGKIGDVSAADWWLARLQLSYSTALRKGTIERLSWENLNVKTCVLDVPPQLMKNRRGKKFILPEETMEALERLGPRKNGPMFFSPWTSRRAIYWHWRQIVERAGIKWSRHCGFHMLRRTSATWVAVKGGLIAAMALLGHSEEYVTRRYVDPTRIPGHNVAAFLPPIPTTASIQAAMRRRSRSA